MCSFCTQFQSFDLSGFHLSLIEIYQYSLYQVLHPRLFFFFLLLNVTKKKKKLWNCCLRWRTESTAWPNKESKEPPFQSVFIGYRGVFTGTSHVLKFSRPGVNLVIGHLTLWEQVYLLLPDCRTPSCTSYRCCPAEDDDELGYILTDLLSKLSLKAILATDYGCGRFCTIWIRHIRGAILTDLGL